MQVFNVVGRDSGVGADFVDEFGDGSDDGLPHFRRLLLVETRLRVETVALRQAEGKRKHRSGM